MLWNLKPFRYSKADRNDPEQYMPALPALMREAELDDLQKCLPVSNVLWSFDSVKFIYQKTVLTVIIRIKISAFLFSLG